MIKFLQEDITVYKKCLVKDKNTRTWSKYKSGKRINYLKEVVVVLSVKKGTFFNFPNNYYSNPLQKCRAQSATVVGYKTLLGRTYKKLDNELIVSGGFSSKVMEYNIGEYIIPDNFDLSCVVCASGIHCFQTFDQASKYDWS